MSLHDDDLVPLLDVRIVRASAPALLCRIGEKTVWLPRDQVSGKLWCTGDRGKLFVRRRIARKLHLIDLHGAAILSLAPSPPRRPVVLHVVRRDGKTDHAA